MNNLFIEALNFVNYHNKDELISKISGLDDKEEIIKKLAPYVGIIKLIGPKVNLQVIGEVVNNGGCAIAKVYRNGIHYVLITEVENLDICVLDINDNDFIGDDYVSLEDSSYCNRRVKMVRFISNNKEDYALMNVMDREVILLQKD